MSQLDWVGDPPRKAFKDIGNQRPSVAEEKAILAKELGELARRIPPACADWSVNRVREFMDSQEKAAKVAANSRATIPELTSALGNLRRHWT